MKRIANVLLLAAAALAVSPARADTHVSIGIHVGNSGYRPARPVIVYGPSSPVVAYTPAPVVVIAPRGYWSEVPAKTWVPERWIVRHDRRGRPVRFCEPGYYTYSSQRVWIHNRNPRGPRGHHHHHGSRWHR